ncbi:A disintegrin and metalloproteinase with thrombospondin motifs 6-like, partial [Limulus polyphemus]|uniref:A disintegrin and metalloproteinase with thrombospondin motifs 6-like n=1 Tax=Limulus polyphemus TaxID=6850 RepID=A0ABM1S8X9_LIMPO
ATLAQTKQYEIAIPTLVNRSGKFLSYDVTYPEVLKRRRRNTAAMFHGFRRIYYNVTILSRLLQLELAANAKLTSRNFAVEQWNSEGIVRKRRRSLSCFFHGHILGSPGSVVSLSNCYGLHGILTLGEDFFFIEPYWNHTKNVHKEGYPHIVYKSTNINVPSAFDLNNEGNVKQLWTRRKRLRREVLSTSVQRYVETLVVADDKMFSYYGEKEIEPYILTIMNIVSKLYGEQSIGNAIDVVVTRLVLLTEKQPDLNITHHASDTLESFCNWQKLINTREVAYRQLEEGIAHHDNAILITRNDICYNKDEPCDTLGLGQVSGMCEPSRSCSINQDIGLISGFTIAHEMGHNFGMQHDGFGNNCAVGLNRSGHIMTTQLSQLVHPVTWSPCSRHYITNFLDSGQGECLKNKPRFEEFDYPSFLPGELYSADEQCQSQYGSLSTICQEAQEEPCEALWCEQPQGGCATNHIPVLDGTPCNDTKVMSGWCHSGQCVTRGTKIEPVDGSWGQWSDWKDCSRSCGGGVEFSERLCNDPRPMNGGDYCIGHRKRFRICNNQHVGCDGILGSIAIEDKCRVCEGDGTTCKTVLGFVDDPFEDKQKEYVEIIRLPKGAVNIRIREKEESTNLIALKTTDDSYHLNGKMEVSWPMTYVILGTRFHYMRTTSHRESLRALGPLSEELIVVLLLEEPNKGVVFSYNTPVEAPSDQANTTSGHFG